MAEMNDSMPGAVRNTPKDAQVMVAILKEMGIDEYEPRLINQMLEFTYRYVTNILEDAQLYSAHAKKKNIDAEDVRLAISLQQDRNFTSVPDRELTSEIAKQKNSAALPAVKTTAGMRLPPDRYSLTACNYRLKSASKKSRTVHGFARVNTQAPGIKASPGMANSSKSNTQPSVAIKGNLTPAAAARPVINVAKPIPTPIIKFTDGITATSVNIPSTTTPQFLMPTIGIMKTENSEMSTEGKPDDNFTA